MHPIEMSLVSFLDAASRGPVELTEETIEEFGEACKAALRKQFTEPQQPWTLRMSNAGKPLCVLVHENAGTMGEARSPWFKVQMMLGDMGEALVIALMRGAGIRIDAKQQAVQLKLGEGKALSGTLDVIAEGKLYDIKTASPWSFSHKFQAGFGALAESDAFGYVGQLYGYATAAGVPVGGWIALDKVTGQIVVCEAPDDRDVANAALTKIVKNARELAQPSPCATRLPDEAEMFRKAPTGNRVLSPACGLCDFKWSCWPELRQIPSLPSSGASPKLTYYTEIAEAYQEKADSYGG